MRTSERLKWIFAALFVLCGLLLPFIDKGDRKAGLLLPGLAALCLAGFALSLAYDAWETGAIKLPEFDYTREGQPRRFVATLVMIVAAGIGTLITALWFLFFK